MAAMKSLLLFLLTITATSALFNKAFLLHEQPFAVQREQPLPGNGNCVDVSRWGEVQYNTTTNTVCSFTVNRVCTPREEEVGIENIFLGLEYFYRCNIFLYSNIFQKEFKYF